MESPAANDAAKPDPGLPPVLPPSGRFIAQLFVIPGLIILVVVLLYVGSTMLVQHEREPAQFLNQLDSDNADIRWRGASDLAQILKRTEPATLRWKTDVKFALDLAERLDAAFDRLVVAEKGIAAQVAASNDKDKHLLWRKLNSERDYVAFLAGLLAQFHAPVGAPVLCRILQHDDSADVSGNNQQRRTTLLVLINLGETLKNTATVPADKRREMIEALKEEADLAGARAAWARTGLVYLDPSALPAGKQDGVVKVDETLVRLADAEDQFLRKLVAMSFNFWDGPQAEATLLKLTNDTGRDTNVPEEGRR